MKKIIISLATVILLFSCVTVLALTLYHPDGKTVETDPSQAQSYLASGWYDEPVVYMYSADGQKKAVPEKDVEIQRSSGWYTEPVVYMYAMDGRVKVVPTRNVDAEKSVGWYDNKADVTVTMYAPDGREKEVFKGRVDMEKAVGWTDNRADVYTTVYEPSGSTLEVLKKNVPQKEAQGWYTYPVMNVYAADGRKLVIRKTAEIEFRKVGWYSVFPVFPQSMNMGNITLYKGQRPVCPVPDFYPQDSVNVRDFNLISSNTYVAEVENYRVTEDLSLYGVILPKNAGKTTVTVVAANGITDAFTVTVRDMTFYDFGTETRIPDFALFANTAADKDISSELGNNCKGYKYSGVGNTLANAYCELLKAYNLAEVQDKKQTGDGYFTRWFVSGDSQYIIGVFWANYNELFVVCQLID